MRSLATEPRSSRPARAGTSRVRARSTAVERHAAAPFIPPAHLRARDLSQPPQRRQPPAEANEAPAPRTAETQEDAGAPDAGTPDAGPSPAPPTPDAGTTGGPPAGGGAPAPAGPPAGGGGPAAPPPRVLRVEVDNPRASITYDIASNRGASGRRHAVTVASLSGTATALRAVVSPAVAPADPAVAGLQWRVNGNPTAATGDPLHLEIPRGAGKRFVQAELGGSRADLTVWAVFARIRPTVNAVAAASNATGLSLSARASFNATILPASIITDADRPALDGANDVDPPGGTNSCGDALSGGADHHWDMSRQIRRNNVDPDGLRPTFDAQPEVTACLRTEIANYPRNNAVGNDDAATGDETNDPYANGGVISSSDTPRRIFPHRVGADGNTFEQRLHFREFARIDYHRTWWTFSHFSPWRVHFRIRRVGGRWVNNASTSATDNAGF